jgi:hypothetical protein
MNSNEAITKHVQWTYRFRNAAHAKEQVDAAAIAKDNNCDLGKWLHGEGKQLHGAHPTLAPGSPFHQASRTVCTTIVELFNTVAR